MSPGAPRPAAWRDVLRAVREETEGELAPRVLEDVYARLVRPPTPRRRLARRMGWIAAAVTGSLTVAAFGMTPTVARWVERLRAPAPSAAPSAPEVDAPRAVAPPERSPRPASSVMRPVRREVSTPLSDEVPQDAAPPTCEAMRARLEAAADAPPSPDVGAWMGAGECFLRRGDKVAALELYRRVCGAFAPTPVSESAWFEVVKLEGELGRDAASDTALQRYLEAFPAGRFVAAATQRRCELMAKRHELAPAKRCLDDFLGRYPTAVSRPQALRLRAAVCRGLGDFAAAYASYRDLLALREDAADGEMLRYRMVEMAARGHLRELAAAVRDYRAHHPNGAHALEVQKLAP